MIYTNRLKYEIDYQAMNRDFYCLRITGKRIESGKPPLPHDLIQKIAEFCQPLSVMHQFGNSMYLLFDKEKASKANLIENFQDSEDFREKGLTFSPIIFTSEITDDFEAHLTGYWVLQLLFNTLAHSDSEHIDAEFQNLYGRLFLPVPVKRKSKHYRDVYEIKVDKPSLLNIKVQRFARFENKDFLEKWLRYNQKAPKVFFKYNKKSGAFTRSQDCFEDLSKYGEVFVNRSNDNRTHPTVHFIDTSQIEKLQRSRTGMYMRFLSEAGALLDKYIKTLELEPMPDRDYENVDKPELPIKKRVLDYYGKHQISTIQLVDLSKDTDSKKLTKILRSHFTKYEIILDEVETSAINTDSEKPVLTILHNKEYYEEHGQKDPYLKLENLIVQHVTVEDFFDADEDITGSVSDAKYLVLLRDLAVKRDLVMGKANFLITEDNDRNHQFVFNLVNGYGQRKKKPMDIYRVKIDKDNSIISELLKDQTDGFELSIADEIENLVNDVKKKYEPYLRIEGWVENEKGERNYIFRTEEIVMPDLTALREEISGWSRELPKDIQSSERMASIIKEYLSEDGVSVETEKTERLVSLLEAEIQAINKPRFKTILSNVFAHQSGAYRHIMKRLQEDYNITFGISRGKAAGDLHEYRAGLRYWEEKGLGFYYSGEWNLSGIKPSKANADHIRVVVPDSSGNLFFKELLPGMNEEIVHLAARSVLPAGFKYVREAMLSQR